jgi:hypothetical protein
MAEDKKKKADEVEFLPPTSQVDLEERLARGHRPAEQVVDNTKNDVLNPEVVSAPYAGDADTSKYLGTDPVYMNYARETERPMQAEEGPEYEAQKRLQSGVAGVRKFVAPDDEPSTEVGVGRTETLNTAVSGEDYSAELVDAEPDHFGPAVIMPASDDVTSTATPGQTKSPAKPAPKVASKTTSTSNS